MHPTSREDPAPAVASRSEPGIVGLFRDPTRTFLVVAIVVGGYFALVVPHFGGIDEPAHFFRSYQISTGRLVPLHPQGSAFSGACLPTDVILGVQRSSGEVFAHTLGLQGVDDPTAPKPSVAGLRRCDDDPSRRFVTFSTFGSPVPYAPQATAILALRTLGADVDGMVLAARLATLAAFVTLVSIAIRRTPRSKWAFCAVGLLPVAVFQSSVSASHDAVTVAMALLVISSALRAIEATDRPRGHLLLEAAVLTVILAACKPGYVVVSVCYLLPLLGARRRRELWPLALIPVVGALASIGWNSLVGNLWKTDASFFGVQVNPGRQRHLLLTEPWHFAGAAARTVGEDLWSWAKQLITLGPSVAVWPSIAILLAVLVFVAVALQPAAAEPARLSAGQRWLVVAVFAVGVLLVLGAQYVYWSRPGADVVGGMQARFFTPLLVLVPIAIGPVRARRLQSVTTRVPLALGLIPLYLAVAVTITLRMY